MNISNLTDSELIAELHERHKEPELSNIEKLLADYNDRIDMIIDDCCDDLEDIKVEIGEIYRISLPYNSLGGLGRNQLSRLASINMSDQLGGISLARKLAASGGLHGGWQ